MGEVWEIICARTDLLVNVFLLPSRISFVNGKVLKVCPNVFAVGFISHLVTVCHKCSCFWNLRPFSSKFLITKSNFQFGFEQKPVTLLAKTTRMAWKQCYPCSKPHSSVLDHTEPVKIITVQGIHLQSTWKQMKTQCSEHKTQIFPTTCGSCVILQKLQKCDAKTETGPTTATPIWNFAFYYYYKCCIETSEYSKDYYGRNRWPV